MPTQEEAERKALAKMYNAIREAKKETNDPRGMDYMIQVAEQAVAEARKHRGEAVGAGLNEFAVELAKLVAKLAKLWIE